MNELERLSAGGSPEERQLLRAGRGLRPNAASKHRALLGLGLASATALTPTTAFALTKLKASLGVAWPIFASKWTAAAVIVTVGASLAVVRAQRAPSTPTPPARAVPMAPASKPSAAPTHEQSHPSASKPLEPSSPTTSVSAPPARPPLPPKRTELELFDAARVRLRGGDPSGALDSLGDQLRQYPGGNLAREARALRIEALDGAGQRTRALAEARAFLAQNPSGLTSHRVRRWLERRTQP